jgi:hypothetical protein
MLRLVSFEAIHTIAMVSNTSNFFNEADQALRSFGGNRVMAEWGKDWRVLAESRIEKKLQRHLLGTRFIVTFCECRGNHVSGYRVVETT